MRELFKYDVVIIGGGTSGCIAAIAAAINGTKVLVIEKENFLGGTITAQPLEAMMTFHDKYGKIINGIPQIIINRLIKANGSGGHVMDDTGYCETITPYNHEILKSIFTNLFDEFKIDVMLNTQVINLTFSQDRIDGIIIKDTCSEIKILVQTVIDASGDGITFDLCSLDYIKGSKENSLMQPASILFKLSNIKANKFKKYILGNLSQFKSFLDNSDFQRIIYQEKRYLHVWGLKSLLKNAYKDGKLSFKKGEMQILLDSDEKSAIINSTRANDIDGTLKSDIQKAFFILRHQVMEVYFLLKELVPGFEKSFLSSVGVNVGIRETRHLIGEYIITEDDILEKQRIDDGIAFCAFPIDIQQPENFSIYFKVYEKRFKISYGCMLPRTISNLLVTGRCISATHTASGALKSSVTCMALGQVAGVAASLAVKRNISVKDVKLRDLRNLLKKIGAIIP